MDLETENRIASMLLKEAAELRRQAEREGVHAYLRQPKERFRPNSRFLTATVLGVQQANRVVEVNEMWQARQKELELDDRCRGRLRDGSSSDSSHRDNNASTNKKPPKSTNNTSASCSSSERVYETGYSMEDEELEEFLHSRVKRGRGGVGPRMDETGPYLPPRQDSREELPTSPDVRKGRVVYGPEKPSSLKSYDSSEEELHEQKRKKAKKVHSGSSNKHRSKDKSNDKKRKRKEEKRNKHHK
ncbi:protein FAM133 isoform X4 [Fagus crenata]